MDKFDVRVTLVFKNIEADRGQDAISACIERLDDGYDDICAEAHICEPIRFMKKDQNNSWQARASYGRGLGLYPSIAA
jgi:hypothetical protein